MVVTKKKILNFLNNYICSTSNKPHIKRLSKYSLTVNENYFRYVFLDMQKLLFNESLNAELLQISRDNLQFYLQFMH